MSKQRKTIGRTFSAPITINETISEPELQIFTLSSGKKVAFIRITIPAEEVESSTYVVQETNGRDQSALTAESLKDITRTMGLQQFFPAIGVRRNSEIEILDGSRRRASAILCRTGLDILVTDQPVTPAEARALAQDIQTAREHNLREVGMRLLMLKNSGMSQKEIAEDENLSPAKVTRALQAASVSGALISLFPVQSELTYSDYKILLTAEELLEGKGVSVAEFNGSIHDKVAIIRGDKGLAEDEVKSQIMAIIKSEALLISQPLSGEKVIVTSLWQFEDKNRYARKKNRGRMFSYEFNRLPAELQAAIDDAVQSILTQHLKN